MTAAQLPMENRLLAFFDGNPGVFAIQKPSGNYVPARRPITLADIKAHLDGKWTVGIYPMIPPDKVWFAAIDIDDHDDAKLYNVRRAAEAIGLWDEHLLLEDSGNKGRHVFVRFGEPILARTARALLHMVLDKAGLGEQGIEVFPKQDSLPEDGLGNLIKLPLGIHRKSGRRSCFIGWDLTPRPPEHIGIVDVVPDAVLRSAAAWKPPARENPQSLAHLVGKSPPTPSRRVPCIRRIERGVKDGARNVACFAYAIYLCNIRCESPEDALIKIRDWNTLNEPPLPDTVLITNVRNAFDRGFTWVNCRDPIMRAKFCSEKCERRDDDND